MKALVLWLALRGFLNFAWYRRFGTWLIRVTGRSAS
jgi:hypothetical protein